MKASIFIAIGLIYQTLTATFTQYEHTKVYTCFYLAKAVMDSKNETERDKLIKPMWYYNTTTTFTELAEVLRKSLMYRCFNIITSDQTQTLHAKLSKKYPLNVKEPTIQNLVIADDIIDMYKRKNQTEIEKYTIAVEEYVEKLAEREREFSQATFNDLKANPGLFGIDYKKIKPLLTKIGTGLIVVVLLFIMFSVYKLLEKKEVPKKKKK